MTHFDADAYLEAIEKPSLTIGGRVYEGELLSLEEYLPFIKRLNKFAELNTEELKDPVEIAKLEIEYESLRQDFFRAIFPKKWIYLIHGDPVKKLQKLPFKDKIFGDFFGLCAAAVSPKAPEQIKKKKTNGTSSPTNQSKESKETEK